MLKGLMLKNQALCGVVLASMVAPLGEKVYSR